MPKTPSYRKRTGYDQAIVTLTDSATKKRRDYWLGEHGTPVSRERYHRLIAAWEAGNRRHPDPIEAGLQPARHASPDPDDARATVAVLIAAYWRWAEGYYQPNESGTLRVALRLLRQHYGSEPAEEFGPRKLRMLREAMISGDPAAEPPRPAWSRTYINQQTQRLRRMFRWAASQEMIPESVYRALNTVESLKRGRTQAREGKKVLPVSPARIEAVRPFVSRQVRAVIDLQLLTGARPGELLGMRPADLETRGVSGDEPEVWIFRPREHKNQFRNKERTIVLGPRAQQVLAPFLEGRDPESPAFSPTEAEAERRATLTAQRATPASCGNRVGSNRTSDPLRSAGDRYTAGELPCRDPACLRPRLPPTPAAGTPRGRDTRRLGPPPHAEAANGAGGLAQGQPLAPAPAPAQRGDRDPQGLRA